MNILTVTQTSVKLGVSKEHVRKLFKNGEFPNAYQIGKAIRIPETDIEAAKKQPFKEKEA